MHLNEPNFSSSTVAVGDPVLCHLAESPNSAAGISRGSYLVGHLDPPKILATFSAGKHEVAV